MKKLLLTLTAVIVTITTIFAQSPQSFKYQAVARNSAGDILANQNISIRISIHEGSEFGPIVYIEEFVSVPTNEFGLINLNIGTGSVISGTFSAINWGANDHFIEIWMDETGGTSYSVMGTAQLLSVPYALHAKTAETVTETDPVFGSSVASGITGADTTNWNNKLDSYTETDPVYGSSVASGITGADTTYWNNKLDTEVDGSVTNELQALSISNDTLYLSNGGTVYLGNYLDNTDTQTLSLSNDTLSISNGNNVILTDNVIDADADPTNEYNTSVILNSTNLEITDGGGTIIADLNSLINDSDADPSNELQVLTISNDTIYLSNGGFVVLPADQTDDGDWTIDADTLYSAADSTVTIKGSNIGIGTTDPGTNLDVNGKITTDYLGVGIVPTTTFFELYTNNANITPPAIIRNDGSGDASIRFTSGGTWSVGIDNSDSDKFKISNDLTVGWNSATDYLVIQTDGNVGIGTTTPGQKLYVAGGNIGIDNARYFVWPNATIFSGAFSTELSSSVDIHFMTGAQSNGTTRLFIENDNGNVGIGTTSPVAKLHVTQSALNVYAALLRNTNVTNSMGLYIETATANSSDAALYVVTAGVGRLMVRNNGNVGIGTTSPNSKLQVSGGDGYYDTIGTGVIIRSPDGNCWRITVSDAGALSTTPVVCP